MDDSDIVVLDDSSEEQPSTSRNVFSIASPAVCQRWTRTSSAQPLQIQRTSPWLNALNPSYNYPSPLITSVTSLSPQRNRQITITDVKSLSPKKNATLNRPKPSYQSRQNSSSYRIREPIITRVESLSPLKKNISNGSISISRPKFEPECIVLDEDDGSINLNTNRSNVPTDLYNMKLRDVKTDQTGTLQMGCESNLTMISSDTDNLLVCEQVEEKPTSVDSCVRVGIADSSYKSNPDGTSRKRIKPTPVTEKNGARDIALSQILQNIKNACLAAADNEKDMNTILDSKLEKSLNNTSQAFKKSSSFHALLSSMLKKVQNDPTNVYVHISELITELKARKASKDEAEEPPKKKFKSSSKSPKTVDYVELQNARDEIKMKKLSKTLSKLQKVIKKLEAKEVNWEDDDDSAYIMLQRYKERAVKVFHKLCEYTKESTSAGKINKIHLSNGTRFPEVNKCVEQFVNSTGQFPDFCDILELMKKSNLTHNMKLHDYEIEEMAKKVFEEVGGELQRQRQHGVAESLLVFMEDGEGDPATASSELKEKLNENAKHWKKITEVIDDFAMRAKEKKGNAESGESKSDDEEEEEDDGEEEDEEEEGSEKEEVGDDDLEKIDMPDFLKGDDEVKSDSEISDNEIDGEVDQERNEPVPADDSN